MLSANILPCPVLNQIPKTIATQFSHIIIYENCIQGFTAFRFHAPSFAAGITTRLCKVRGLRVEGARGRGDFQLTGFQTRLRALLLVHRRKSSRLHKSHKISFLPPIIPLSIRRRLPLHLISAPSRQRSQLRHVVAPFVTLGSFSKRFDIG